MESLELIVVFAAVCLAVVAIPASIILLSVKLSLPRWGLVKICSLFMFLVLALLAFMPLWLAVSAAISITYTAHQQHLVFVGQQTHLDEPVQARRFALFAMCYGLLCIALTCYIFLQEHETMQNRSSIGVLTAYGACLTFFSYYAKRMRPWAYVGLFILFALQSFELFSQTFSYSLIGPLPALKLSFNWSAAATRIGVNFVALGAMYFALQGRSIAQVSRATQEQDVG